MIATEGKALGDPTRGYLARGAIILELKIFVDSRISGV
jgi:hypothetical protein